MAMRRENPARRAVAAPAVTAAISNEALDSARDAWRKDAPRRYWGLFDAKREPAASTQQTQS